LDADVDVIRVVRGGSWRFAVIYARCAFRNGPLPVDRLDYLGFRVLLRAAPVP